MSNTAEKKIETKVAKEEEEGVAAEADICCANCGIAEVDDIKLLKECDGCDLVKYCSDKCRENHREQHQEECKKRQSELHDRKLFEQPEGIHLGECPVCFLPMPLHEEEYVCLPCCSKLVCHGCVIANLNSIKNDYADWNKARLCILCREPALTGNWARSKMMKKSEGKRPGCIVPNGS